MQERKFTIQNSNREGIGPFKITAVKLSQRTSKKAKIIPHEKAKLTPLGKSLELNSVGYKSSK